MRKNRKIGRGLYVITDCANMSTDNLLAVTEDVLKAGIAMLQYRDKSAHHARRKYEALELQKLCRRYHCPFIINDDVRLAKSVNSDGVHLGDGDCDCRHARNELGVGALIGVSCYNRMDTALIAAADGADYVAFGAFYPSGSKPEAVTADAGIIKQAKAKMLLPVAAIGGITPANCLPLLECGADLLAVIGSIYQAREPGPVVGEFNRLMAAF